MFRNKTKIASSRKVKAPFGPESTSHAPTQALQHHTSVVTDNARKRARQEDVAAQPVPAALHQHNSRASKAHALAVFQGLVESASRARQSSTVPEAAAIAAPVLCPAAQQEAKVLDVGNSSAVQHMHVPAQATMPAAVPATEPQLIADPTIDCLQPSFPELRQKASERLQKLHQQVQIRSKTYLYQFDTVLQQAKEAVTAVAQHMQAATAKAQAVSGLNVQSDELSCGHPDALLNLSCRIWDIIMLLLEHHHAAEPDNTATQAREFHQAASILWESCATEAAAGNAAKEGRAAVNDTPSDALLQGLNTIAQVASSWADIDAQDCADWCYLQLRKHLCSIKQAEEDVRQQLPVRKSLQKLLFAILQGNILIVTRQGQQILWSNLTSMFQQLLASSVLDPEDNISACLTLAGALSQLQTSHGGNNCRDSSRSLHQHRAAADTPTADTSGVSYKVLEFAADLLGYCRKQVESIQHQQDQLQKQQQQQGVPEDTGEGSSTDQMEVVLQHISSVQQEVLLQLSHAYLQSQDYSRTLDCVNTIRGLLSGRPPPEGLVQLSSLALLGQGKHLPACAQLCAWLKQSCADSTSSCSSSSSAAEACAAVDAFLQTLYSKASCSPAEVSQLVEMIAEAAAEYCRGDAGVAVAVVKQLLTRLASSEQGDHLEQLVLKLLATEAVAQNILKGSEDRQAIHALLHQHGQLQYEARNFTSAVQVLTPAVFFSTTVTVGKSARLLAATLLKAQQPQRAIEYVSLAEQQEGQVTAVGCLIRLQAALMKAAVAGTAGATKQGQAAAGSVCGSVLDTGISAALQALVACTGFDSQTLQAAFSMCMQVSNHTVAWELLKLCSNSATSVNTSRQPAAAAAELSDPQQLQKVVQQTPAEAEATGGCTQITVLVLMHSTFQAEVNTAHTSSSCSSSSRSRLLDICLIYSACTAAAAAANITAASEPAVSDEKAELGYSLQQLMWLTDTGLQLGVLAAEQSLLESSLAFMHGAGDCCSALQQHLERRHVRADAYLDTAAGSVQDQQPGSGLEAVLVPLYMRHASAVCATVSLLLQSTETNAVAASKPMKQAQQLLHLAYNNLLLLQQVQDDSTAAAKLCSRQTEHQLQHLVSKLSFTVAVQLQNELMMKKSLQQMVQNPLAKPSDFQAAAQYCLTQTPGRRSDAVAALAYGYMLRLATAPSPAVAAAAVGGSGVQVSVDLAAAADAVIGIMTLVPSHGVKLKALAKVTAALTVQQQGTTTEFPAGSLQWLIATCWNAAVQLGAVQHDAAVALQYLDCVAALAAYQTTTSSAGIVAGAAAPAGAMMSHNSSACPEAVRDRCQQQQQHWLVNTYKYASLKASLQVMVREAETDIRQSAEQAVTAVVAEEAATQSKPPAGCYIDADQSADEQQQLAKPAVGADMDQPARWESVMNDMQQHQYTCESAALGPQQLLHLRRGTQCNPKVQQATDAAAVADQSQEAAVSAGAAAVTESHQSKGQARAVEGHVMHQAEPSDPSQVNCVQHDYSQQQAAAPAAASVVGSPPPLRLHDSVHAAANPSINDNVNTKDGKLPAAASQLLIVHSQQLQDQEQQSPLLVAQEVYEAAPDACAAAADLTMAGNSQCAASVMNRAETALKSLGPSSVSPVEGVGEDAASVLQEQVAAELHTRSNIQCTAENHLLMIVAAQQTSDMKVQAKGDSCWEEAAVAAAAGGVETALTSEVQDVVMATPDSGVTPDAVAGRAATAVYVEQIAASAVIAEGAAGQGAVLPGPVTAVQADSDDIMQPVSVTTVAAKDCHSQETAAADNLQQQSMEESQELELHLQLSCGSDCVAMPGSLPYVAAEGVSFQTLTSQKASPAALGCTAAGQVTLADCSGIDPATNSQPDATRLVEAMPEPMNLPTSDNKKQPAAEEVHASHQPLEGLQTLCDGVGPAAAVGGGVERSDNEKDRDAVCNTGPAMSASIAGVSRGMAGLVTSGDQWWHCADSQLHAKDLGQADGKHVNQHPHLSQPYEGMEDDEEFGQGLQLVLSVNDGDD